MLDGRRRAGRRAGRTSSPDFFRTMGGLLDISSSLSSGELVRASSRFVSIAVSVDDRECEIFLADLDRRRWLGLGSRLSVIVDELGD